MIPVSFAQQTKAGQPQIRVNYLNVCAPTDAESKEIAAALARLPDNPSFAVDFEVARGRSSMTDTGLFAAGAGAQMSTDPPAISRWVRVRREFPEKSPFSNVQYSFSVTENRAVETLVFRVRDPKDMMLVSISDTVDIGADPAVVVRTDTPADRVRLERFGKSSLALARCRESDQSGYEPLFQSASRTLAAYRGWLKVRDIVPADLQKVGAHEAKPGAAHSQVVPGKATKPKAAPLKALDKKQ
ncbi:MAG TPA: hypothetical protein VN622_17060 [Clostridia bacterium]|nr:hypothetical protein [Clostridia bacterium]